MACQKQRYSLLDAPSGCRLRVRALTGDSGTKSRLFSMGLIPGTEVQICTGLRLGGGRRVRVRGCSFVLGGAVAASVVCEPSFDNGMMVGEAS